MSSKRTTRASKQRGDITLIDMSDDTNVWKAADTTKNYAKQQPSAPKKEEEEGRTTRSTRSKSTASNNTTSNNIVQSINITARKRNPPTSKKKKNNPTIRSDQIIIQALEEANYEAYIDPYRGIMPYFSISFPSSVPSSSNGDNNNGNNGGINNGGGSSSGNSNSNEEKESPWIKCQDVLLLNSNKKKQWNFNNTNDDDDEDDEVIDVDEDSQSTLPSSTKTSNNNKNNSNNKSEEDVAILVQTGCTTVDNWAIDELELYTKKLAVKNKKSNNARGKKRKSDGQFLSGSDDAKSGDDTGDDTNDVVMENSKSKEKKEPLLICGDRKRDVRNGNATILHCCDYNPYCLASLGGIVDQYRQSAAQIRYAISTNTSSSNKKKKPSASDISKQIHDNLSNKLQNTTFPLQQNKWNGNKLKEEKRLDNGLRTAIFVDLDVITNHVSSYICEIDKNVNAKEFVGHIKSCHQPLLFKPDQSSTLSQSSTDNGTVELSQPSGLRNLGATCYLNSQLQCLAQNLGFIHGLFSWKKPTNTGGSNGSKRMTEVLSHMQSILARMRYGPDRVLCTNEFASALSLENNEMQDPNEFARLLFDRMAESFRRSAEISSSTNGSLEQRGLGELLPSVFGGTTQYVTSCSVCGKESTRSEDYMELLIPIVDVEVEGMKKAGSKLKKDRGKPTAPDVDVQHCVDTYLFPESLDGDNQYECSQCRKKVDATRRMRFAKLPPVLNLQLARYVFDRETLSKRKLTTKVLLPKSLEIPSTATTKQNEHSRYILCAVQNHLGTSAHGGHYVADVMDWTTGVWYEFNDEEVTRLEGGPVSSFDPSKTKKGQEPRQPGNGRKVNGSQDAYNLFYVEQTYLARHAKSELSQFMNNESPGNDDSILSSIKLQRSERFKVEVDQMHRQLLRGRRLTARKDLIVDKLFQPTRSTESKVWVDSNFLRRFLSCEDDLEDLFRNAIKSNTLYKRESFLCEHSQGLNPRKARQGKLLSMDMYDALESILRHEYEMFLDDRSEDTKLARHLTLMDHKFIDGENLTCQACGVSYQQETAKKYELFDTLISINDGLLPGLNDFSTVDDTEDSPDIYVISRTWVTSFKEYMKKKVREMKTPPVRGAEEVINSLCGGIDVVDLKEVTGEGKTDGYKSTDNSVDLTSDTVDPSKKEEERRDRDPFKGEEDPTQKVTCDHGKCSVMHNRQHRRLITGDMWRNISKAFPEAVAHRYEHPRDDATGNCEQCLLEKEEGKLFPQKIIEWKDNILQSETLNELLERGSTSPNSYPSAVDVALLHNSEEPMTCRVLHGVDVQRWRNCVDVASKFTKKKAKSSRQRLNELMFISSNSSSLGREFRFRPLTCEHNRAVVDIPREEEVPSWLQKLNESGLELLFDQEYEELVQSLSTLESILHYDGNANFPSAPTICLRVEESKSSTNITPRICHRGCKFSLFNDEILEEGKIIPKPKQVKRPAKKEPVEEAPKGPLCKIHIHEIDSGSDIVVATSLIMLDISSDQETQHTSSNGRPQRSRKARGDKGSFPTHELEMALDGNLAHFRLLLHQSKGKKLFDQRLFLISPGSSVEAQELLPGESNLKTMQELAASGSSNVKEASTNAADCELHMALTYGSSDSTSDTTKPNSRKRVSRQEEKAEEEVLLVTLSDIACGGWKTADGNDVVVGGKKTKRRRQERGFQGTFLQSTELTPPSQDDGSATKDVEDDEDDDVVIIDDSKKDESQVSVDVVKPAAEETVEALLSSGNCSLATQPDDDDRPTTQQFDDSQVTAYESQPITQQFDDTQTTVTESKKPKNTKTRKLLAKDCPCSGCDGPLNDDFLMCPSCRLFFCTKCDEEGKYQTHIASCPATKENHSPPTV